MAPSTDRFTAPASDLPAIGTRPLAASRPAIYGARPLCLLAGVLLLTLLLRLAASASVTLIPEEAYYWMYAQHPSLSYYDHPPMVAWLIDLGTVIFGHNEFGVRFGNNLLMVAAGGLMYAFARQWFGHRTALVSAVVLQVLPVYFALGLIATMDAALVFFWLLCLVGVGVALRRGRAWGWYLAGVGFGGALLSKYTGVFLSVGLFLALMAHRPWTAHLKRPHVYLGGLLGVAMFSPVLVWNAQHDWASFRFQFIDRFQPDPITAKHLLGFVGSQLAVFTPVLLLAWGVAARRMVRVPARLLQPRWVIVWCFSVPLLAVLAWKSLRHGIHLNWSVPAYLSAIPGVAHLGLAGWRVGRHSVSRAWAEVAARTAVVCMAINAGMLGYLMVLQPRVGWISAFGPWEGVATAVEDHEDRLEAATGHEPLIIADGKYRLASVLAFYRRPIEAGQDTPDFTTSQWIVGRQGLGFPYWAPEDGWVGRDCIYVLPDTDSDELLNARERFESVEVVSDPRLERSGYRIAICRGLRQVVVPTSTKDPT